ncbi:hypothetical protein F5Y12DRAFT_799330 [Xylaria sp. FL1777]|nr:hypothetical protein F5Y12DRAFT_799330 [Xylaria sp. FL1777]
METHDQKPSCLSVDPHDDNIKDPVLHYFGCLEAWHRSSFFDSTSPYWIGEVERLENSGTCRAEAKAIVETKREICRKTCSDELRRVSLILGAIAKDKHQSFLLRKLASSRKLWLSTGEYQSGIEKVREWRTCRGMPNGVSIEYPQNAMEELYNPDNVTVSVMAFEKGLPHNIGVPYVTGMFPNQTTNVHDLLRRDTPGLFDLLGQKKHAATTLTWLHIPSNNMLQEIVASYYGEKRPSIDQMRHGDEASRATRLLREYFWRGQQYGNPTKPSSRFMRPFCEFIAPSRSYMESETEKVVLFAPFLHWETSRQLTLITRKIEETLATTINTQRLKAETEKEKRIKERQGLSTARPASRWPLSSAGELRIDTIKLVVEREAKFYRSRHPLGQYLLDAARLYEEVRNYEDTSLIQKYLFADPPLHPRRTLDQGYYTTLRTTRSRDRDQVIYRATTPTRSLCHQFDHSTGLWMCPEHELSSDRCDECRANIRKVSSVAMVDQLWMWVLDPGMIITCFPKRYGVRGHDPSGVFEAIQRRLVRDRPVHSVFAIAQAVLDECSSTFFHRTKDDSGQPPILDIFSEAIQNVSRKQTSETRRLWYWIDHARRINRQQEPQGKLDIPTWTMRAEGDLEREIQDIVEELEIIISVNKTQADVYKKFILHATRLMNSDSSGRTWRDFGEALFARPMLIGRVEDRIGHLESILKTASNASDLVKDLSHLRQQQDSVIQALQSVKLSLDSIDQGRTIMVFTIVTIIFSPLSFLSSIFGMNNAEFGDNQWKVTDQLKFILSISVGITALALVFASSRVRSAAIYATTCITHPFPSLRRAMRSLSIMLDYISWIMKTRRRTFQKSPAETSSTTGV